MRVLIADDDPVLRRAVRAHLEKWSFEVVECCDGREAWTTLQRPDAPALAVVDWSMPGMDGVDLCHNIRHHASLAAMYVILLTSNQAKEHEIAGLESGADDYITKPVHWEELHARIRIGARIVGLQQTLAARVHELQDALSKVKTLSGLLPICAYCKRIRDDRDYWRQIEHYVTEHSSAQFSHGICPECLTTQVAGEFK